MKAIKGNKVYTIRGDQEKHYREAGFDILDDAGKILSYGRGKTVPYEAYASVVRELEELKGRQGKNTGNTARASEKAGKKVP